MQPARLRVDESDEDFARRSFWLRHLGCFLSSGYWWNTYSHDAHLIHQHAAHTPMTRSAATSKFGIGPTLIAERKLMLVRDRARYVRVLTTQADVFVMLAATGHMRLLVGLLDPPPSDEEPVCGAEDTQIAVDWTHMMRAACLCGQLQVAEWLCTPKTSSWVKADRRWERLRLGVEAAVKQLVQTGALDRLKQLQSSHLLTTLGLEADINTAIHGLDNQLTIVPSPPSQQPITPTQDNGTATFRVVTDRSLFKYITGFSERLHAAASRLERKLDTSWQNHEGGSSMSSWPINGHGNTLGMLCIKAIIDDDLYALQVFYAMPESLITVHSTFRDSFFADKYYMRHAMHAAACVGRLRILQWLHSLHDNELGCRPDTMAMAVRYGHADVVEWLHLHRPESSVTMSECAINDAVRIGHSDALVVCATYRLGEFTAQTLDTIVCEGSVELLENLSHATDLRQFYRPHHVQMAQDHDKPGIAAWLTQHWVNDNCTSL